MILRGLKTIEYRSRPTKIIGERFWIYAAKKKVPASVATQGIWSRDLAAPGDAPLPAWMMELAELLILNKLPTGVIVGSAVIEKVTQGDEYFHWHLSNVERIEIPRKPVGHPQPSWFNPF